MVLRGYRSSFPLSLYLSILSIYPVKSILIVHVSTNLISTIISNYQAMLRALYLFHGMLEL